MVALCFCSLIVAIAAMASTANKMFELEMALAHSPLTHIGGAPMGPGADRARAAHRENVDAAKKSIARLRICNRIAIAVAILSVIGMILAITLTA